MTDEKCVRAHAHLSPSQQTPLCRARTLTYARARTRTQPGHGWSPQLYLLRPLCFTSLFQLMLVALGKSRILSTPTTTFLADSFLSIHF